MGGSPIMKYLPHSSLDEAWQLYCTGVGYGCSPAGASYPPRAELHPPEYVGGLVSAGRTLNEYQLVYIISGRGSFWCAGLPSVEIEEGSAFLLFPGLRHGYLPRPETGWTEYWVGFRGAYPEALQKAGFFSPKSPIYRPGPDPELVQDYQSLLELAETEPPGFQQLMAARVVAMLARLVSGTKADRQDEGAEDIVRRIRATMEEHLYDELDTAALERSLGLPYYRYNVLFREYTGLSPHQYFLQLKINHAKTLLAQRRLSVKEVASMLGFENEFYFSRLFKKKTGLSPSRWKDSIEIPAEDPGEAASP
jgi:AraC-type DNA-binding domain-containing proteins